jgi:hypothetical protein
MAALLALREGARPATITNRPQIVRLPPSTCDRGVSGSIPEVIEDGITGKVVDSEEEAVAALREILSYDRRAVRQRFEEKFTATRMAKDYVSTYRKLSKKHTANQEPQGTWPRQLSLQNGNGLTLHVD